MNATIIKDKWVTPADLCVAAVKQACTAAGIQ